jgi:hypothetical protein
MSKDLITDKEQFIRLILANIENETATPERAKAYLSSEGYDVNAVVSSGMAAIESLKLKIAQEKDTLVEKTRTSIRTWHHESVKCLIEETGNPDPMDAIKTKARDLVLQAFELGWQGPPYSPIQLAKLMNIDVIPNDEVADARILPIKNNFQIQYNPFQRQTRINFSVSHEIAHTLFSDCANSIRNREENPVEHRELEQLCNAAAAEIQLPYAIFSNDANSAVPSMAGLIDLAKKYNASLESVFLRYTEVIDRPCAILIGIFQTDNKIVIDYHKASRTFPIQLPGYIEIPTDAKAYECTSPGWTSTEEHVTWSFFQGQAYDVYAAGISPYRRDSKPRVGILILPVTDEKRDIEFGKVIIEYGDATKPRGKGSKIIAQLVNTSAGLGQGFGKSLAKNYPAVKSELDKWKADKSRFKLGQSNLIKINNGLYIFQMLAQKGFYATAGEIPLRYNELRKCLVELRETALHLGCSVHMPAIGAGQAKGNWDIIIGMIHDELVNYDLRVNIYFFPDRPLNQKSPSNLTFFNLDSTWQNGKLF